MKPYLDEISFNRLKPYRQICRTEQEAIAVYAALQYRSSIFFPIIQDIEVAVRNQMSHILREYAAPQKDLRAFFHTLMRSGSQLSPESQTVLKKTFADLSKYKSSPDENDIISNLTFGFWVHLINDDTSKNPHYSYWYGIFNGRLFDNRFTSLKDAFMCLRQVLSFRNDLFHQEAVWKNKNITTPIKALKNMHKKYRNFSKYLAQIAPKRMMMRQAVPTQTQLEQTLFCEHTFINEIQKSGSLIMNEQLFERAKQIIPAGVNSPVRAFGSVGGIPRFIAKAQGAHVWDANGTQYIDYVGSWGTGIVGHAHPEVVEAVREAAVGGLSFGAPTEAEIVIAEEIAKIVPSVERLRLVSSGTEATMTAIRLARGYTGRDKIVKFEGCYHGHSDSLLVKAGSGLLTFGNPSSAGVPADLTQHTIVLPYNDVAALKQAFDEFGTQIAGVILEPIAGNMNLVRATAEFVQTLRQVTEQNGAVLIYDEVMTGFRVALGGAQSLHGITPDLTTMGKVIGGGMPLAAFGGKKEIMDCISPLGGVYQAGTLSGNPVAVAAGLKTLEIIQRPDFYENLSARTQQLAQGLTAAAQSAGIEFCADSVGGMFGLYFAPQFPQTYADMMASNVDGFKQFFHAMLDKNVAFGPSAYEAGFVSTAHTPELIDETIEIAKQVFAQMK